MIILVILFPALLGMFAILMSFALDKEPIIINIPKKFSPPVTTYSDDTFDLEIININEGDSVIILDNNDSYTGPI